MRRNLILTLVGTVLVPLMVLCLAPCAQAQLDIPICYTMYYDPVLNFTRIETCPNNTAALPIWPQRAPFWGIPIWIPPGAIVVVPDVGAVTGPFVLTGIPAINIKHNAKNWVVSNIEPPPPPPPPAPPPAKTVRVWNRTSGATTILQPGTGIPIPKCNSFCIRGPGKWMATGCEITALEDDTEVDVFSDTWGGDPTDERVELLRGMVKSVDNLGSFTSIYTPQVVTGCPEPGSLLALGGGLVGLAGMILRRRR